MARARNPNRDKAFEIWADAVKNNKDIKLKDIAIQLKEKENKVRKWKCEDKWETKLNGTLQNNKRSVPFSDNDKKKKRGGQPKNTNAVTHGGYKQIYLDSLDEEEKILMDCTPDDEEEQLKEQIALYTINERRLLRAIKKVINGVSVKNKDGEDIIGTQIMNTAMQQEQEGGSESNIYETRTKTVTFEHTDNRYLRLQAELTKVQRAKTKCIEALAKLHLEKERLELIRDSNDIDVEDTSDIEEKIYGD